MLLVFSNFEITPKFSVDQNKQKQQKNISHKETSDKISFQNKVLHPNTGEMKLAFMSVSHNFNTEICN